MPGAYLTPIDISNSALDYNGADPIVAFTDNSTAAAIVSREYDKLRDAELRRNVWAFAIRKAPLRAVDVTTYLLEPETYNPAKSYVQGSIVTLNNVIYISAQFVNMNTPPGTPNEAFWWVYYGPLTATPWNPPPPLGTQGIPFWSSSVTYNDGQFVIGSDNLVYVCLVGTSTNNNPVGDMGVHWASTGTSAAGTTTPSYYAGELVYNLVGTTVNVYQCLTTGTTDNPTLAPLLWQAAVTYNIGDTVVDGFGAVWQSEIDLNVNNPPTGFPWFSVSAGALDQNVGQNWLQLNAKVQFQRVNYPIGAGPRNQSTTRNIYRLPSGYKRMAPQDPKAGAVSYLGAPSGLPESDWEIEGDYIVTRDSKVLIFRFVADIQDVTRMDPMFCEMLSLRLAIKIAPRLTNSTAKVSELGAEYRLWGGEARAVNGIETGPTEPAVDDFLACRL